MAARDVVGHLRDLPLGLEGEIEGRREAADEVGLEEAQLDARGQSPRDPQMREGVDRELQALLGALLLCAAYLVSAVIPAEYASVPVGLVTVCLGGVYLIWLLIRESRRSGLTPA